MNEVSKNKPLESDCLAWNPISVTGGSVTLNRFTSPFCACSPSENHNMYPKGSF